MAGLSEIYLRDQRSYHDKLESEIGQEVAASLSPTSLREAMKRALSNEGVLAPHQWNNAVRHLRAAWKWGKTQEILATTPFDVIKEIKIKKGKVEFFTIEEAQKMIDACDNRSLAYFAIGMFAGVRPFELQKLRWEHVDLKRREIIVLSEVSKTNGARIIPMEDNLREMLAGCIDFDGFIAPRVNRRKILEAAKKGAGLMNRAPDIMRHSYATYFRARDRSMDNLMAAMGHSIKETSLKHYLGLARDFEAERYFSILPPS